MKARLIFLATFLLILFAVIGQFYTPYDPLEADLSLKFAPISQEHLLGCDHLGRDIFSRIASGAGVSLFAAFASIILILFFGILIGSICALNHKADAIFMRIADVFLCFPTIVLALFFISVLGSGLLNVITAIALTHWAWYARIVRSLILSRKNQEFVLVSRMLKTPLIKQLKWHFAKDIASSLAVLATLDIGHIMLHVAALGLLGLGIGAPSPEWGAMIADAKTSVLTHPNALISAGAAMMICVGIFNLLGDTLRDYLEPK